ncbi:hypothetical protein IEO21_00737 [Rhodonia placenta]|uniref:Uncharacterized protein n=1 Tax=Rhodonia placenta TaxID=104341 RepID=A0A8H7PB82_9APHY|nr:hypothetical protein IEO21_00737 [Postia placenta]
MSSVEHSFLFASLDSKQPRSARKVHIRRLFDILQLSLLRNDLERARRAWAILIRCKEIHWRDMWTTAVGLLGEDAPPDDADSDEEKINFLRIAMRQHLDERELILKELTLRLIRAGMHREALDELDLNLPTFPFQDNPVLHVYAGLLAVYLAQPKPNPEPFPGHPWDMGLLAIAQSHFERAKSIDPDNCVAIGFLKQVHYFCFRTCNYFNICCVHPQLPTITQPAHDRATPESDDESMTVDRSEQRRKRVKT